MLKESILTFGNGILTYSFLLVLPLIVGTGIWAVATLLVLSLSSELSTPCIIILLVYKYSGTIT